MSEFVDEFGTHVGYCNGCGEEGDVYLDCRFCEDGEMVQYDDDKEEI